MSDTVRLVIRLTLAGEKAVAVGEPAPVIFFEADTGQPFKGVVWVAQDGQTFWGRRG